MTFRFPAHPKNSQITMSFRFPAHPKNPQNYHDENTNFS
jgi:hypothetical protein